nr:G protein-coupled receptor [Proales similis]
MEEKEDKLDWNYMYYLAVQIYSIVSTVSLLFGCLFNLLALVVLLKARSASPRMASMINLTTIAWANVVCSLLNWLIQVSPLIAGFGLWKRDTLIYTILNLVNSNVITCKLLHHVFSNVRCLSALVTVDFSLERCLAVVAPNKTARFRESKVYCLVRLFVYVLVSIAVSTGRVLNISIEPNSTSVGKMCVNMNKEETLFDQSFENLFLFISLVFPFCIILICNIIILKRLRSSFLRGEFRYNRNSICRRLRDHPECNSELSAFTGSISGYRRSILADSIRHSTQLREPIGYSSRKNSKSGTKCILIYTSLFVMSNSTYIIKIAAYQLFDHKYSEEKIGRMPNITNWENQLKYWIIDMTADALHIVGVNLSGVLLFAFGNYFRTHLGNLLGHLRHTCMRPFACSK